MDKAGKVHELCISKRQSAHLTGVDEIISAQPTLVVLETSSGMLYIKGSGLSLGRLDVETGELTFAGEICSMEYKAKKSAKGIVSRIFR